MGYIDGYRVPDAPGDGKRMVHGSFATLLDA